MNVRVDSESGTSKARCDVDIEAGGGDEVLRAAGQYSRLQAIRARTILLGVEEAVEMYRLP